MPDNKLHCSNFSLVEEYHGLQQKMVVAQKQCDQQEKELTQLR